MEWFTLQMEIACLHKKISPVYKIEPIVSHPIYADDPIIVTKATLTAVETINEIFKQLETTVGMKLNEA